MEEFNLIKDEIKEIKDNLLFEKKLESKLITPLHIDFITSYSPKMLIFGCGIIGSLLIKKFYEKYKIYVYSRDISKHSSLQTKFPNVNFIIGDVRDYDNVSRNISLIFPTVIILNFSLYSEENVNEMIKTNINGVSNIVNAIIDNPVYLHSSINKTILYFNNPFNIYKQIAEKLIINSVEDINNLKFISLRLGNLIESKDNIINKSHFVGKTLSKNSFVLNSPHSTIFLDKLNVDIVDDLIINGKHKHIYIPFFKCYNVKNILKHFHKHYNKLINHSGLSCLESLHETLINETEALRTIKNEQYYTILPIREKFKDTQLYNSNLDILRILKPNCPELTNGYNSDENVSDFGGL